MFNVTQGEQITRYEYDLLGRLVKVITPDGAETAYAYDALGNLVGETDPLGNQTRFAYTVENLLEQVTYANGATQSLTYDLAGNVISETDGEGNTKRYQYDRVNRLIAVIDEAGNKTSYGYDALDNITKVTDALKQVTRYTYDQNGNLLSETDALGNTVEYAYTPEGWLSAITKADGTVLTFAYDKTGNLLTQNTGENQSIESSYNEIGQVTTVTSSEGTITYQYNQQGYLVSVTNGNGDVVSYTYDQYGNKLSMTYPDGRVVSYTYDSMNRMTSVTGLDGDITRYTYDAAGRRVETASSTLTTAYSYDSVGNLLTQATSGASEIAFSYAYNKNGYITGEVRKENGTTTENTYAYDALGQLTSFLQSTGYGEQYAYDKAGNMTEKVLTGTDGVITALKMSYNKANQFTTMANGRDKITYKYDKNGSMVEKALSSKAYGKLTDSYTYNALDQFTSYTGYDGYQQQFSYDANGMRLSKKEYGNGNRSTLEELLRGEIAGLPEVVVPVIVSEDEAAVPAEYDWATTEYLYDITQEYYQVIQQTTTSGNTTETTAYTYGLERIAAYDANNTTQYIYDGRGSVAQTISAPAAGASVSAALPQVEVQSYAYTAFGEQMGVKVSGFGYNAEDFDAATGMINLRMRQYEPALLRFSTKDLYRGNLVHSLSLQRYLFVYSNPLNWIDPDDLRPAVSNEGALYLFERKNINDAKSINTRNILKGFTNKLESNIRRWNKEMVQKGEGAIANYLQTCSQDLKSAVSFAQKHRSILAGSDELVAFQKARERMAKIIAQMHIRIGRRSSGISEEIYRYICEQTFQNMSANDISKITNEINTGIGLDRPYAMIYNNIIASVYPYDSENDVENIVPSENGDYEVFLELGPLNVKSYTPAEQSEIDIMENQRKSADEKMPVSYLKSFIAKACEYDAHYSGAQTYVIKDKYLTDDEFAEYDCVSLAGRAAASTWFDPKENRSLGIATYVESSYQQGTNHRVVTASMERYDGMQLCRVINNNKNEDAFQHQAVYFSEIEINGVIWRDVIIDIRGKAYPDNATEAQMTEVDNHNMGEIINIIPFDDPEYGFSFYTYAFDLRDVDYSDVK